MTLQSSHNFININAARNADSLVVSMPRLKYFYLKHVLVFVWLPLFFYRCVCKTLLLENHQINAQKYIQMDMAGYLKIKKKHLWTEMTFRKHKWAAFLRQNIEYDLKVLLVSRRYLVCNFVKGKSTARTLWALDSAVCLSAGCLFSFRYLMKRVDKADTGL